MKIKDFNQLKDNFNLYKGINGREEYFQSVVLLLLIPNNGEYQLVFQKRCAKIRQAGEICFSGGKIDMKDKTIQDTALRETEEELGIPRDKIEIISQLDTIVAPMGAIIEAFVGIADIDINDICINKDEVEKFFTIPLSYFINTEPEIHSVVVKAFPSIIDKKTDKEIILLPSEQLELPNIYHQPWGNFNYKVYVYKTNYGVIWGITSRLIYDCISKIKLLYHNINKSIDE